MRVRCIYPEGNILEIAIVRSSANTAGRLYKFFPIHAASISFHMALAYLPLAKLLNERNILEIVQLSKLCSCSKRENLEILSVSSYSSIFSSVLTFAAVQHSTFIQWITTTAVT